MWRCEQIVLLYAAYTCEDYDGDAGSDDGDDDDKLQRHEHCATKWQENSRLLTHMGFSGPVIEKLLGHFYDIVKQFQAMFGHISSYLKAVFEFCLSYVYAIVISVLFIFRSCFGHF